MKKYTHAVARRQSRSRPNHHGRRYAAAHIGDARACASCGAIDDLILNDDTETVFCEACASPLSSLEFSEYYCDLGGEA